MITSNIIEKKPLSNAMKDNILNNFCELFEGSNQAYAVATTTQQTTKQKKVFADYTTVKKPPTQELFVNHLRGTQRFTNIPIRGDRCKFGAKYGGAFARRGCSRVAGDLCTSCEFPV